MFGNRKKNSDKSPVPPKLGEWLVKSMFPEDGSYPILGDLEEMYQYQVEDKRIVYARIWYWFQVVTAITPSIGNLFYWGWWMFLENMKIALRTMYKHLGYSLLNIAGMAIGLACCIVIVLYITNEVTYDRHHPDSERTYRINSHVHNVIGESVRATSGAWLFPELLADHADKIESASRVIPPFEGTNHVLVQRDDIRHFEGRIFFVDSDIFTIFDIPFVYGSCHQALERPFTILLTQSMAQKYFGDENPIGQTLAIEFNYDYWCPVEIREFEVTGIIEETPSNTHFKYDMLVSMATVYSHLPNFDQLYRDFHTKYNYIKLAEGVDPEEFEELLQVYADEDAERYAQLTGRRLVLNEFLLQPIESIHTTHGIYRELEPPVNWYYLYIYAIIAGLILLIGCLNFMNLSAALSTTRTREVGLRKVVGAFKKQIMKQFLTESFLVSGIAFLLAFLLAAVFLTPFNSLAGTELTLADIANPWILTVLVGLLFIVSLGSGAYPSFILTRVRPASILKGSRFFSSKGAGVQRILVLGQFVISILLVVSTLTVFRQLQFMKSGALGFDREQKLVLQVNSNVNFFRREYDAIRDAFTQHPGILGATVSSAVPGEQEGGYYMHIRGTNPEPPPRLKVFTVDYHFLEEYGISMVAGRPFEETSGNDERDAFIVNESGARELGFQTPEEALGNVIWAHYHGMEKTIVGVCEDFHFLGMQQQIDPLVLDIENSLMSFITLNVSTENLPETITFLESTWQHYFPEAPFEYRFLDEIFDRQYRYEEQASRLLMTITFLGLSIACLGLLGMASFMAHRRQKEIGIRKVLGASDLDIVSLLSRQYLLIIGIAGMIASPLAWLIMQRWLQDFAYRISLGWQVFAIAFGVSVLIAFMTVLFQGLKAASSNPAEVLRAE